MKQEKLAQLGYQIFSHVYDVKRSIPTQFAWGRGNGWVLYSLAELLERMPNNHSMFAELLCLFRKLCESYSKLQDEKSYCHQVLTDYETYEETSCTTMFVYAFNKAFKNRWVKNALPYEIAARNGWRAISHTS